MQCLPIANAPTVATAVLPSVEVLTAGQVRLGSEPDSWVPVLGRPHDCPLRLR
jgi:hypothetical protein